MAAVSAEEVDALLPQTQCTRCGYPDCRAYAEAIAQAGAPINRCPPGGAEGIGRLARLTGQALRELDPHCGHEGPRRLARIDEAWCIGCTLCIQACPVDCIVGAPRMMHSVIEALCTGCELCVPACPVDCIAMPAVSGAETGWAAWSPAQAQQARARYRSRGARLARAARENEERLAQRAAQKLQDLAALQPAADGELAARKQAAVQAALERVRARRENAGET
ncbi:MAG: electron transport complex subunit RsxB [Rubrivivax sp.]